VFKTHRTKETSLAPPIKSKPTNEEPKEVRDSAVIAPAVISKDGNEGEWKEKRID